jgi:hypothetical protein
MSTNILIGLIILFLLFGPQIITWTIIQLLRLNKYIITEYKVIKRIIKLSKKR